MYEDDVGEEKKFTLTAEESGVFKICFAAIEIQSNPALTRDFIFDTVQTDPLPQDDKLGAAQTVLKLARETFLDLKYGKERIVKLGGISIKLRRNVTLIAIAAILITWALMFAESAWLSLEVRRRA